MSWTKKLKEIPPKKHQKMEKTKSGKSLSLGEWCLKSLKKSKIQILKLICSPKIQNIKKLKHLITTCGGDEETSRHGGGENEKKFYLEVKGRI